MKHTLYLLMALLSAGSLYTSCGNSTNTAWLHEDDVRVAIDETFAPIMDEEAQAFALKHIEATMLPTYVSEDSALHLLMADSLTMAVVTRGLTEKEEAYIKGQGRSVLQAKIATDAFALVLSEGEYPTHLHARFPEPPRAILAPAEYSPLRRSFPPYGISRW